MPRVFIPPLLRTVTDGLETVDVSGQTVRELIDQIEAKFPGLRERLLANDQLRPGLSVAVGSKVSAKGLLHKVRPDDEIHFLPAIGGG